MNIEPVYQPIVDLRDGSVIGYEALARGRGGNGLASPEALFAAARAQGRVAELDRACREAALAGAVEGGLGAPFCLFVNADAGALEDDLPETPRSGFTLVMEVTERALTERPEPLLRALTELRRMGWGVALDDVGADSRSLALMPVLYPDVIKLDLRLLRERAPEDVARIVTAVGAEAEKRLATVLAEGIDSEEQLAAARAAGATLGQGYHLGEPAPLPEELPSPGRGLRLTSSGGVPENVVPYQRVTNWRRPADGSTSLAERAAALLSAQAAKLGSTGLLLAAAPDDDPLPASQLERYQALAAEIGFVGVLGGGATDAVEGLRGGPLPAGDLLRGTWTEVALGPGYGACFVARRVDDGTWRFAISYDHETVVECAVVLMARMPSLAAVN
ncbi:MAG TPA: EAL domain-containing protein [Solirubrobacteraceae bacterium]|nr:EAL domain-containing protein [Solirubrobacteraceae bacterium]